MMWLRRAITAVACATFSAALAAPALADPDEEAGAEDAVEVVAPTDADLFDSFTTVRAAPTAQSRLLTPGEMRARKRVQRLLAEQTAPEIEAARRAEEAAERAQRAAAVEDARRWTPMPESAAEPADAAVVALAAEERAALIETALAAYGAAPLPDALQGWKDQSRTLAEIGPVADGPLGRNGLLGAFSIVTAAPGREADAATLAAELDAYAAHGHVVAITAGRVEDRYIARWAEVLSSEASDIAARLRGEDALDPDLIADVQRLLIDVEGLQSEAPVLESDRP